MAFITSWIDERIKVATTTAVAQVLTPENLDKISTTLTAAVEKIITDESAKIIAQVISSADVVVHDVGDEVTKVAGQVSTDINQVADHITVDTTQIADAVSKAVHDSLGGLIPHFPGFGMTPPPTPQG